MSVHRFLTNIDVVYAVFGHLDLFPRPITATNFDRSELDHGYEALTTRRTLVNAALTCRAFSEPASKALWTCLHSCGGGGLKPLLKALNQKLWNSATRSQSQNGSTLTVLPLENDISHF
ncbi:hypothetical protein C8Q74DRAFT_1451041 [Fomes fomentarius]|nr:hypothetical protein C8Q74DRAFT_1451041 [Fomes fomentarius]